MEIILIKLSKTGWNNVIIFVVMGFILLINFTNKKVHSPEINAEISEHNAAIVGQQNIILTLTIDNVIAIERIGRTWRANPAKISGQALDQMMMSWQQSDAEVLLKAPGIDQQFSLNAKLDIAGNTEYLTLNFYATDQQLLVFKHESNQWLALPIAMYGQLFPPEIFTD